MTRVRILVVIAAIAILVGLSVIFGAVVSAIADTSDPTTNCDETTCEVYWEMPGSLNGEATWPQKLAYADQLHCTSWYQADRYPKDKIADLIADGTLTQGEDYGIAISWHFVYGGDCTAGTETPTETETPTWPSTPTTTPTASTPTEPTPTETTTPPPTTPSTTPTVETTTPVFPTTTPSTVRTPPIEQKSTRASTPPEQDGSTTTRTTPSRLADTSGKFDGYLIPIGLLLLLGGTMLLIFGFKKNA